MKLNGRQKKSVCGLMAIGKQLFLTTDLTWVLCNLPDERSVNSERERSHRDV